MLNQAGEFSKYKAMIKEYSNISLKNSNLLELNINFIKQKGKEYTKKKCGD